MDEPTALKYIKQLCRMNAALKELAEAGKDFTAIQVQLGNPDKRKDFVAKFPRHHQNEVDFLSKELEEIIEKMPV